MPGTSPYMDGFFNVILTRLGTAIANTTRINLSAAFSAVLNPDGSVTIDTSATAGVNGQAITPSSVVTGDVTTTGDVTVGGSLILPGAIDKSELARTSGSTPGTILTLPFPNDAIGRLTLDVVAWSAAVPDFFSFGGGPLTIAVKSSVYSVIAGSMSTEGHSYGIPPMVALTWSAGSLILTGTGPTIAVTGTSNLGGGTGKVRVTCAAGGLTADLNSHPVDISGIVGTTEANGTNLTATFVTATTFDLLGVTFVNARVSGGTVKLHNTPALDWTSSARLTFAA